MKAGPKDLVVARCESCHGRFLPRPGPCPRCGSTSVVPQPIPPEGEVLAATELTAPAAGWPAPHRIALVELSDDVRVLAQVLGPLPSIGDPVTVETIEERFVVRTGTPGPA
jgi:uncharacterized OB-fold protein